MPPQLNEEFFGKMHVTVCKASSSLNLMTVFFPLLLVTSPDSVRAILQLSTESLSVAGNKGRDQPRV